MPKRELRAPSTGGTVMLDEKAAAKIASGFIEAKLGNIREILSKREEIIRMKAEDVEKLARLTEANVVANGGCGIGCC